MSLTRRFPWAVNGTEFKGISGLKNLKDNKLSEIAPQKDKILVIYQPNFHLELDDIKPFLSLAEQGKI